MTRELHLNIFRQGTADRVTVAGWIPGTKEHAHVFCPPGADLMRARALVELQLPHTSVRLVP